MTLCSAVRGAAFVHQAIVIPILYAFARPLRTLDLVLITLTADILLCSFRTPCVRHQRVEPRPLWSAVVCGTLMAGVTMTVHASPFFGGDERSLYRSSILALQMVVSTALLPLVAARERTTETVLALGEALAVSIVWGALRVTWLDVALLWLWNLVGHAVIALLGMRSFAPL